MSAIYPIAKLGNQILVVNTEDIPKIGKKHALDVMCVKINLDKREIDDLFPLEQHLKFNPWQELSPEESKDMTNKLKEIFTQEEITKNITKPLQIQKTPLTEK